MGPQVTHMPCDLNQQQKRRDARKDSVARAVARRTGRRTLLDRILRRAPALPEIEADDLRPTAGEDVFHGFRF